MTTSLATTELPGQIQNLLQQREEHASAIKQIDRTLANVVTALGGTPVMPAAAPSVSSVAVSKRPPVKKVLRKRSKYAASATDLVMAFVKAKGNPTSKEIAQHLADKGRSPGATSNALSVLAAAKKLKRTPLGKGKMGSTYSIA